MKEVIANIESKIHFYLNLLNVIFYTCLVSRLLLLFCLTWREKMASSSSSGDKPTHMIMDQQCFLINRQVVSDIAYIKSIKRIIN